MDRRAKAFRRLTGEAPEGTAAEGDAPDPPTREPRCNACRAWDRPHENADEVGGRIDDGLWRGESLTDIKASIDPLQTSWPKRDQVSYDTIRRHAKRHLQLDRQLARALMLRARENAGHGLGWVVPPVAAAELMLYRGTQALLLGATPTPAATLDAARFLHDIGKETHTFTLRDLEAQVQDLLRITRAVTSPDQWAQIVARMRSAWGDRAPGINASPTRKPPAERSRPTSASEKEA